MKTAFQIFKEQPELMENEAVKELIASYENVCDQLIDLEQVHAMNKEAALKELTHDIIKAINHEVSRDEESLRFKETPRVDFKQAILHLKSYIFNYLKDYSIRLD